MKIICILCYCLSTRNNLNKFCWFLKPFVCSSSDIWGAYLNCQKNPKKQNLPPLMFLALGQLRFRWYVRVTLCNSHGLPLRTLLFQNLSQVATLCSHTAVSELFPAGGAAAVLLAPLSASRPVVLFPYSSRDPAPLQHFLRFHSLLQFSFF